MLLEPLKRAWLAFQTQVDALCGHDVFIVHCRADAAEYARSLFTVLQAEGIASFIDQVVYGPGESLLVSTRRHAAKPSLLVALDLLDSCSGNEAAREIRHYWDFRGALKRIVKAKCVRSLRAPEGYLQTRETIQRRFAAQLQRSAPTERGLS
jgi:hypothetical protein